MPEMPIPQTPDTLDPAFQPFAERIVEAMRRLRVPGVAVGMLHEGREHVAGFGVTSIENPLPVTPDTLFQIGSTTKTVTATAAMRLVERGTLDLDAPVRAYLPDLRLADESVAERVTLRHLFTHTGGWEGDYFEDTGGGDDALARMVAHLDTLPQLTPLGQLYAYNNAGFYIAGRVIEVVAGKPYEAVAKELVLDPLGMDNSFFFPGDVMTRRFAVGHLEPHDSPEVARPWPIARSGNAVGGLASSARDQLRYARFHMGDGARLLSPESMRAMQTPQGPGGNDIDAVGISWLLCDLDGTRTVRHGGATLGQLSAFLFVPSRGFALTILTNAQKGDQLNTELRPWALGQYLGLLAPDEPHLALGADELAAYAGRYTAALSEVELAVEGDCLRMTDIPKHGFPDKNSPPPPAEPPTHHALVSPDRLVGLDGEMRAAHSDVLRDAAGGIAWIRVGGRLLRRQPS